jgi:hypothetical protein
LAGVFLVVSGRRAIFYEIFDLAANPNRRWMKSI